MQNIKYILMTLAAVLALEVVNVEYAQTAVQPANAPVTVTPAPAVTGNVATKPAPKKKHKNKKKDKPEDVAPASTK